MGRIEGNVGDRRLSPEEQECRALTLRAIGWLLLVFDGIVAVFVFVGIRSGSWLWLYWTALEGLAGVAFIFAGLRIEQNASAAAGHVVTPHLEAKQDVEPHKAA